jgi:hypothetical protein
LDLGTGASSNKSLSLNSGFFGFGAVSVNKSSSDVVGFSLCGILALCKTLVNFAILATVSKFIFAGAFFRFAPCKILVKFSHCVILPIFEIS